MSESAGKLNIEVVFALRDRQELMTLEIDKGATVADAIEQSAIAAAFPEWDMEHSAVGIWGHPVSREQPLCEGDRVEIYRPLAIDPREARRALAAEGRSMGKHRDDSGRRSQRKSGDADPDAES